MDIVIKLLILNNVNMNGKSFSIYQIILNGEYIGTFRYQGHMISIVRELMAVNKNNNIIFVGDRDLTDLFSAQLV